MNYNFNIEKQDFIDMDIRGVTSIISAVFGAEEFKGIPEHVMEQAKIRGSAVHDAIEEFINTGHMQIDLEYQIYIDYFMDWFKEYDPRFLCAELKLYDRELGYKGIVDALFLVGNTLVMCDWKTSSNLNVFKAGLQLTLYAKLVHHLRHFVPEIAEIMQDRNIDELRVLSVTKTGYKYIKVPYNMETADALLHLYKEKLKYTTGKVYDLM